MGRYERYVCDRNGGEKARYLRRRLWRCPCCGNDREWNGHICQDCHRRVCCACFHHDMGCCLTAPGSDCDPGPYGRAKLEVPCPGPKA
jgi:hypothetical protein